MTGSRALEGSDLRCVEWSDQQETVTWAGLLNSLSASSGSISAKVSQARESPDGLSPRSYLDLRFLQNSENG